jgi:hypothetical protein
MFVVGFQRDANIQHQNSITSQQQPVAARTGLNRAAEPITLKMSSCHGCDAPMTIWRESEIVDAWHFGFYRKQVACLDHGGFLRKNSMKNRPL